MTVNEFANKNSLRVHTLPDGQREIKGGYVGDLLSWVMGRASADDAWITIMSNRNVIAVAALADVACVILAEGVIPDEEFVKTAEEKGINILSSEADAYRLAVMLANEQI